MLFIGDYIISQRKKKGMTQKELVENICSEVTLSRIENNQQTPNYNTVTKLLMKLGLPPSLFPAYMNEKELELLTLRHEINQHLIHERHDEAEVLLNKMIRKAKGETVFEQYVAYIQAIMLMKSNAEEALNALIKAAKMSINDLAPKNILRQAMTQDELGMLKNIAICYERTNKYDEAIEIYYAILEYIEEKVIAHKDISALYTAVTYLLSCLVGQKGDMKEVIRLCDDGIKRCLEFGTYYSLAGLLYNKGYALVETEGPCAACKYIQEAYYIYRARGNRLNCEHTLKYAIKNGIPV